MSKPSATFDAMPPEIKQLIIAFAIGGPTSHVNLLGEELEVIADTATIKPLLSVSRATKSTLEDVLCKFMVPATPWYIEAPEIVRRLARVTSNSTWKKHARRLTIDAMETKGAQHLETIASFPTWRPSQSSSSGKTGAYVPTTMPPENSAPGTSCAGSSVGVEHRQRSRASSTADIRTRQSCCCSTSAGKIIRYVVIQQAQFYSGSKLTGSTFPRRRSSDWAYTRIC
jgi:hypothetical protein